MLIITRQYTDNKSLMLKKESGEAYNDYLVLKRFYSVIIISKIDSLNEDQILQQSYGQFYQH